MVSTIAPTEVGYFEDLREMPAAGPFVICRLLNRRFAVEVSTRSGPGCPSVPRQHVMAVLEESGRGRGNYFKREKAIAAATFLNELVAAGSLDPWVDLETTTTSSTPETQG